MAATTPGYGDLKDAMKKMLKEKGIMDKVKAQIRAELFGNVDGKSTASEAQPPPPRETMILNELFREFLTFNDYSQTLSVFNAETEHAQPAELFSRSFISNELGINDNGEEDTPLIYALVHSYKSVCSMQQVLAPIVDRTPEMFDRSSNQDNERDRSPGRMNTMDLAMPTSPERDDDSIDDYPPVIEIDSN